MQTTNQKEGIDIVEGAKLLFAFTGWTIEQGMENESNPFYNYLFYMSSAKDSKFHSNFEWLMPAIKKFQDLDPIPAFPQWVTWCEQINNTLIKTYKPLPVFYVLVEAVRDYNLHIQK